MVAVENAALAHVVAVVAVAAVDDDAPCGNDGPTCRLRC